MEKSLEEELSAIKAERDSLSGQNEKDVKKEKDKKERTIIAELIRTAEADADVFWEILFDVSDDEEELADTVDILIRLYLQRNIKALYWTFAVMNGEGITVPIYIVSGAAFASLRSVMYYLGPFFMRIAWQMNKTMEELDMEDFLYKRLMK